jgi:hypothetical protein
LILLRINLGGSGLRRVEDGFQGPQIAVTHDRVEALSVRRKAEAIQRKTMLPFGQGVTRRPWMRTPVCGLSMMLVVARQRPSEGGTSRRLMVKHSSRPSTGLEAAERCFYSSQAASQNRVLEPVPQGVPQNSSYKGLLSASGIFRTKEKPVELTGFSGY